MTRQRFDYFVVLAGMRTGSNLLEEQLAAMPGLSCHGELFNPHFFGKPDIREMWDISMGSRDADPLRVVRSMLDNTTGLPGFRLFYDHDRRVVEHVLKDRLAAKIVLSRRPIDSYVSLKIARKTGQWWLGDFKSARAAKVSFDLDEYVEFLSELSTFHSELKRSLQTTGQTAFQISYDDLADKDIMAGLAKFLGAGGPPDQRKVRAKVQNPSSLRVRLSNPEVAAKSLSELETPDIDRFPIHEPDRGPGLRMFRAGKSIPLVYMPIRGAWKDPIPAWLDSIDPSGTETGMSQRELRRWKRETPGHLSFTVLRHPLPRAYDAFCRYILPEGVENYSEIRAALTDRYQIPLPSGDKDQNLDACRFAFLGFLKFLAGNLGGQTSLRVDNTWASQAALLGAIGQFSVPDRVLRANHLSRGLTEMAQEMGFDLGSVPTEPTTEASYRLADVVSPEIEKACSTAYRRDYIAFGFDRWQAV